jgi:hypothetical protein
MSVFSEAFADPAFRGLNADVGGVAEADDGPVLKMLATMSVTLGRVASSLQAESDRKRLLSSKLRFAPIQPIIAPVVAGAVVLSNAEIWGPKTGYFWAVQSIRVGGLADATADDSLTATGAVAAGAGAATLPAGSVINGFTVTLSTPGTGGTATVQNVVGGPLVYNLGTSSTFSQNFPGGLAQSGTNAITVVVADPTAVGNVVAYGTTLGFNVDNVGIYRGPPAQTPLQNFMNEVDAQNPTWRPGRTELILQPGDFLTMAGTGLAATQVAGGFDTIIGTVDLLADFLV